MTRVLTCATLFLLMADVAFAQATNTGTDMEPGITQSRKMPRGRRARGEVRDPSGDEVTTGVPNPARTTTLSSGEELMPENTPFPPRGFAKGTVMVVGDDSGPKGTYRLAFKYQGSGQVLPFIECKMFEAFENSLDEHGTAARHEGLVVEVKGYVTTYRGTNFLFLHDYRMPKGKLPGGGTPASLGSATTKPK